METFRFASPEWLAALPLLAVWAWLWGRRGVPSALGYPSRALLGATGGGVQGGATRRLRVLRWLVWGLLALGLARPQIEKAQVREDDRGINVMLALDFSGTMRTRDFLLDGRRVARREGLKRVGAEFIRGRPHDRVGLVCFDRDAYLAAPLTLDHEWLLARLAAEESGSGTALGSGLLVAAEHLQRHTNETRVVILMTDAENLSAGPPPEDVAEVLRPLGVRVHVIQLLSPNQGNPMNDLSPYLTRVALRTGGAFFRVRDGADLRQVYGEIDRLEKHRLRDVRQRGYRELFAMFAVPGLLVFLLEVGLGETRWRRLP